MKLLQHLQQAGLTLFFKTRSWRTNMFGSKQAKNDNLKRLVNELRTHGEMTTGELASALQVSQDAIEDYLTSLEDHKVKLCQKGRKISLAEWWNDRK